MLNFYFDMDGVLAVFKDFHDLPVHQRPFFREGSHYFLHCMPDYKALEIFQTLYGPEVPNAKVHVLTRLLGEDANASPELVREWWIDKRAWLLSNTRNVDTSTCFIASGPDKGELLRDVPRHQRRYHILIDDYNPNLLNWQAAGGTAVKYINQLNNPDSFKGMSLLKEWPASQCLNALLSLQVIA